MTFRHRFVETLESVSAVHWDALRGSDDPFTSHAFLAGLERQSCLDPRYGWNPRHLLIEDAAGQLLAAAPAYLKTNSHGEFVFDHAWADAYQRAGGHYYPKLLVAVPYSPVGGPRLLVGTRPELRPVLTSALESFVREHRLSSAHINFHRPEEPPEGDWLERADLQFHWHNDGYADFEAFLAALQSKKRKNVRAERAQVARAGIAMRVVRGDQAQPEQIRAAHRLYGRTFEHKGNHPALTLGFFEHLASSLGRGLILVLAERGDEIVAMALCLRSKDTLYGRYWGCFEEIPGLHFECCYYQGIDYCIREGLQRFEPGAQGEHKLARGFLPSSTCSSHFLPMPEFRSAVSRALQHERSWLRGYREELMRHSPFRAGAEP